MLTIPVGDLLSSYDGDSKKFAFEGPIFDGYIEDIQFLEPLEFSIKLITIDGGIHAIFQNLKTRILYEDKKENISLNEFEREWKLKKDPLDADDVGIIDSKKMTIDLKDCIRQEIIMAFHNSNL